jgi:S-adenosylmethionine:tRNA ribosyltransferase-isomerase
MKTDLFNYHAPEELIAQTPRPRGQSRLMVVHRSSGRFEHRQFTDIVDYLEPQDLLVANNTRVSARRIPALRANGLPAEVLLIAPQTDVTWYALVKPGRSFRLGSSITLLGPDGETCSVTVIGSTADGGRVIEFPNTDQSQRAAFWGNTPLPPYIGPQLNREDEERYQTVYSQEPGSAAAPTAGLHFTPELMDTIRSRGTSIEYVTLNVGVGTFRPVRAENIEEHEMHSEIVTVPALTVDAVNSCRGKVVAVGTTTVRALESSRRADINPDADPQLRVSPFVGPTNLFLRPGSAIESIDALITNFHQPKSTLLMMISALAGRELILEAYAEAVKERYLLFSFGDAMLIL